MVSYLILFQIVTLEYFCYASKIFITVHLPAASHNVPLIHIANNLSSKGHEVTMLTPYKTNLLHKNITYLNTKQITLVPLSSYYYSLRSLFDVPNLISIFRKIYWRSNIFHELTNQLLIDEKTQLLLGSNKMYDLVIFDDFNSFALRGFCKKFNASCISFSPTKYNSIINSLVGNTNDLSYNSAIYSMFHKDLTFFERTYNLLIFLFEQFNYLFISIPIHNNLLQKYFKGIPYLSTIIQDTTLIIQNSYLAINNPQSKTPVLIEIGGMHIKEVTEAPSDIKKFLDEASDGVIYFSMGSMLDSSNTKEVENIFIDVFSRLNLSVIWKSDGSDFKIRNNKTKVVKWAPQTYILSHPNVKLFVTHGGLYSVTEALYFAKPVFGIPYFGDQIGNLKLVEENGLGLHIPYGKTNVENVFNAIQEILNNKRFMENVRSLSNIFKDRLQPPFENTMHWIDFVLKYEDTDILHPSSMSQTCYEFFMLDVIAFFSLTILCSTWIICKICSLTMSSYFVNNKKVKKNKMHGLKVYNKGITT